MLVQSEVIAPDDKAFFRELEALYLLRLLLISCSSSLESCAYALQDPNPILTACLQSRPASQALLHHFHIMY